MTNSPPAGKWAIIAGGFGLPDRTASAIRAVGLAKLIGSIGYAPLILGKFPHVPERPSDQYLMDINGIPARDIRKPWRQSAYCNYVSDGSSVSEVARKLGVENVACVLLYNYPSFGLMSVMKMCAAIDIPVALDLTEWYGWEGKKIYRNILRICSSEMRMRILARKVGNVICTSSWLARAISAKNTMVLPFAVDLTEERWAERRNSSLLHSHVRTFVYSGSPGMGMYKDLLPEIVQAFSALRRIHNNFLFDIYGITKEQFLTEVPQQQDVLSHLDEHVRFHGKVNHDKALDALAQAHFSIFVRKPNRVANAGFPTKYVEASALGIPVIANLTSDIGTFLKHRRNGIEVKGHRASAVFRAIKAAMELDEAAYHDMREIQSENDPFALDRWKAEAERFMQRLKEQSK